MDKFNEIIQGEVTVLVEYFATWCGPCKMMHPVLEQIHEKLGSKVRILKVDIDKNEQLAAQFNVRSVPTLMIFKGGELKFRTAGVQSAAALEAELEKYY